MRFVYCTVSSGQEVISRFLFFVMTDQCYQSYSKCLFSCSRVDSSTKRHLFQTRELFLCLYHYFSSLSPFRLSPFPILICFFFSPPLSLASVSMRLLPPRHQAKVRELEEKCRTQSEQFNLLSKELEKFRLQAGKFDILSTEPLTVCESPGSPNKSLSQLLNGLAAPTEKGKGHLLALKLMLSADKCYAATVDHLYSSVKLIKMYHSSLIGAISSKSHRDHLSGLPS